MFLIDPFPRTAIFVIVSSCNLFIEFPLGPSNFPTKLNFGCSLTGTTTRTDSLKTMIKLWDPHVTTYGRNMYFTREICIFPLSLLWGSGQLIKQLFYSKIGLSLSKILHNLLFTWLVFRDRCLRVLSRGPEPSRLLESDRFLQKEKWKAFNDFNQKLGCLNFQDYLSVLLQNKNKWKCTKLTSLKLNEKKNKSVDMLYEKLWMKWPQRKVKHTTKRKQWRSSSARLRKLNSLKSKIKIKMSGYHPIFRAKN